MPTPKIPRTCKVCGKDFLAYTHNVKIGGGNYCSRPCYFNRNGVTLEERFWRKVEKTETCWVWTGFKDWDAYGRFGQFGVFHMQAHRYSWELHNGPIPDGLLVCHTCDNPPCVRPDHLFLGTHTDNQRDRIAKGRFRALPHPLAKR